MKIKNVAMLFITITALQTEAFEISPHVIYGEDNRCEISEVEDPVLQKISDATLAIIPKDMVRFDKGGYARIVGRKYGEEFNLCSDEPYSDQPIAANCSGSLVGDDLIATAGHCVTQYDCSTYQFVFGYRMTKDGQVPEHIPDADVYSCRSVVAHKLNGSQDYALIQLDRPVQNREPLKLQVQAVHAGDDIYVIGHPGGLPTKLADGAKVRSDFGDFFNSNLDTYGGNSGSAVFNAKTHEVVGVLVRGDTDFFYDETRKCFYSNRCQDSGCRGEDATAIRFIQEALDYHRSQRPTL